MAIQIYFATRNTMMLTFEQHIGTSPLLDIRTGPQPSTIGTVDSGDELVHMQLPAVWLTYPANGQVSKEGVWSGTAVGNGTVGHFIIKKWDDTVTYIQGSVTAIDAGGDMEIDNVAITVGDTVTVDTFTLSLGHA